ncbi:MAG: hypothetical protein GXO66_02475, partial [Euryarchaeota archaeon]|nr:hypothetical protein [Euryarchaeota archaeon]
RQVYGIGDRVTVHINATREGVLNLTAPGYARVLNLSPGLHNLSFTLPELLSGTYSINYSFGNFSSSYPFDVRGYFARILELSLDRNDYSAGDNFTLTAIIEASRDFNATVNLSLFSPELRRIARYSFGWEFSAGVNTVTYTGRLKTSHSGTHVLVPTVIVDLPGHSPVVLVSGAKYFEAAAHNTPAGSGVRVKVGNVRVTFSSVAQPGETRVVVRSGGTPLPSSFRLLGSYYDITTTAGYSGSVEVCIAYNESQAGDENNLRLLHNENGTWVDVTTSVDTASNTVCGTVRGFSEFVVVELMGAPYQRGEYSAEAVLLANSIDLALAGDFLSHLRWRGIRLYVVNASSFGGYSSRQYVIILGGHRAYEGVGEIVASLLSEEEKRQVEEGGVFIKKRSAFRDGQVVYIFAGGDRNATAQTWREAYEEVAKEIEYNWGY